MSTLLFALAGALVWIGLVEGTSVTSALFGSFLGVLLQRLFFRNRPSTEPRRESKPRTFTRRLTAGTRLAFRFLADLVTANFQQLRLVLAPRLRIRPQWLHYETRLRDPKLRVLLGLMISLTPGTLTAELEGNLLTVHVLDSDDPESVGEAIRSRFETLLMELER